jgi:hypothetical protein
VFEKFGVLVISMAGGGGNILKGIVGDLTFNFKECIQEGRGSIFLWK